jgi:hypothetical protein
MPSAWANCATGSAHKGVDERVGFIGIPLAVVAGAQASFIAALKRIDVGQCGNDGA